VLNPPLEFTDELRFILRDDLQEGGFISSVEDSCSRLQSDIDSVIGLFYQFKATTSGVEHLSDRTSFQSELSSADSLSSPLRTDLN
jgi:hypothetical protein